MTLRKNIFLKFSLLITILVIAIVGTFFFLFIQHHVNDQQNLYSVRARILAGEFSQLVKANSRDAVRSYLLKEVTQNYSLDYAYIKRGKEIFESTFSRGIPVGMISPHPVTPGKVIVNRLSGEHGTIYYDISIGLEPENTTFHLGLNRNRIIRGMRGFLTLSILIGLGVIIIGFVFSFFYSRRMTSEINMLAKTITSFTGNKEVLTGRSIQTESEVKSLINTFEELAGKQAKSAKALEESEKKLMEAQRVAKIGHYSFDIPGNSWVSSEGLNAIFGIDDSMERTLENWAGLVYEEDREMMTNYFRNDVIGKKEKFDREYRITALDSGEVKWVHGLGELKYNKQGKALEMFGTIQDITQRRLAEDRYKDLVEKAGIAIIIDGINGEFIYCNARFCEIYGYTQDEIKKKSIRTLVHPEHVDEVMSIHNSRIREEDVPSRYEFRGVRKDGTVIHLETDAVLLKEGNKVIGTRSYLWDISERKKSEEQFRLIAENTGDNITIVTFDRKLEYRYVSPSAKALFGYDPLELIGKSFIDFVHEDDMKALRPLLKKYLLQKGEKRLTGRYTSQSETIEFRLKRKDGGWRDIQSTVNILGNRLLAVSRDVTERKKAEKALKDSEEKYRTLGNNLPGIIYRDYPEDETRFEIFNENIREITGYSRKELTRKGILSLYPILVEEDIPKYKRKVKESIRKRREFETEYRLVHKNGTVKNILEIGLPVFDAHGSFLYIDGIILDNTVQKKALEEVKRQKAFFQTAIDALTHPFYIVDAKDFRIMMKNTVANRFAPRQDTRCFEITHGRKTPCTGRNYPCPVKEILRNGKPVVVEHNHRDIEGNRIVHEVHGFPITDDSGEVVQVIEYCLDITARREAEEESARQKEQLLRADKMISLGILVSGVAHEINNPNNSILLNSELLTRVWKDIVLALEDEEKFDPSIRFGGLKIGKIREKGPELLEGIVKSSHRIKSIVDDLKKYARKDEFGDYSYININAVIQSAVNLMQSFIRKHTGHFSMNLHNELPELFANFQKIEQVIINLIQNSCHALRSEKEGISIYTGIDHNGENLLVEISDEGAGIGKSDLKLIKEPFFTTKRETGGTGLGLSVSDKIINEHGGKMDFLSEKGKGTSVRITLPIEFLSDVREQKYE